MKAVILQPSYIPWRGYFDQIRQADVFVFYDDVQYDRRGWRNRNRIKTRQGPQWLTIPVLARGAQTEGIPIRHIRVCWDEDWATAHWKAIRHAYAQAPFFKTYAAQVEEMYGQRPEYLADFTIDLSVRLAHLLGIDTPRFLRSSELEGVRGSKTARLLSVLQKVGADTYLSGPSAREYIEEDLFRQAGIGLEYMTYNYPEYPQLYPPFNGQVSILDLLFMTGGKALEYL